MELLHLGLALALIAINGFFVAAEFALVKARPARLAQMAEGGSIVARVAGWLSGRLDASLSACQLGITLASLGLGWVGEPAFHDLVASCLSWLSVPDSAVKIASLIVAFTMITALHLVVGEQAPKIFAIRNPELMATWCAIPLAVFYYVAYPFLICLQHATSMLLAAMGVDSSDEHGSPHTEEELRNLVAQSHVHGELSRSEAQLINAVLEFDDQTAQKIMTPRGDVISLRLDAPLQEWIDTVRKYHLSRYPVVDKSLESTLGVLHVQHLVGLDPSQPVDRKSFLKPPQFVPETIPIKDLLQHFKTSHSLLAFVVDEHGTVVGIVSLEDVLEELVGELEDEFDEQVHDVVDEGGGQYRVLGNTPLLDLNKATGLKLMSNDADTIAGVVMAQLGRVAQEGDELDVDGASIKVLRTLGPRVSIVSVRLHTPPSEDDSASEDGSPTSNTAGSSGDASKRTSGGGDAS